MTQSDMDEIGRQEYERLVGANARLRRAVEGVARALEIERTEAVKCADWGSPAWTLSYEQSQARTSAQIGLLLSAVGKEAIRMVDGLPMRVQGFSSYVALRDLRLAMDQLFGTSTSEG